MVCLSRRRADTKAILDGVNLVPSQTGADFYDRLSRDGRWDRFVAVVSYCSIHGFTAEDAVGVIIKCFPGYIKKRNFDVATFKSLVADFPELSQAWGYGAIGDDVSDIQVRNHALKLVMGSNSLDDVKTYVDIYGSSLKKSDISNKNNEDKSTTFNFNLTRTGS